MNTLTIAQRINNPTNTSDSEITSLKELTLKYPYSQVFSILYLKALANENSFNFEEELPYHAYKISDRNKLYELIHTVEIQKHSEEKLLTEVETPVVLNVPDIITEITNENNNSAIENELNIEENVIINEETSAIEKKDIISTPLDIEIISNAISNVFSQEFEPEIEDKEDKTHTQIVENHPSNTSPKPFSSWLKANKTNTSVPKIDQIINQFIQDEPSITKPTKEFYSPVKQGQKSLDSSSIIYSETLANILAIQGNYPKAILAYEQLILTIPEKKIYFVQKIKELKEKLNS